MRHPWAKEYKKLLEPTEGKIRAYALVSGGKVSLTTHWPCLVRKKTCLCHQICSTVSWCLSCDQGRESEDEKEEEERILNRWKTNKWSGCDRNDWYGSVCIFVRICVCACVFVWMCTCVIVHVHMSVYVSVHCVHMCVCACVHMCVYVSMHMHGCVSVCCLSWHWLPYSPNEGFSLSRKPCFSSTSVTQVWSLGPVTIRMCRDCLLI